MMIQDVNYNSSEIFQLVDALKTIDEYDVRVVTYNTK